MSSCKECSGELSTSFALAAQLLLKHRPIKTEINTAQKSSLCVFAPDVATDTFAKRVPRTGIVTQKHCGSALHKCKCHNDFRRLKEA